MAKTFSDTLRNAGFATIDRSERRTIFEFEKPVVHNAAGESLVMNSVNSGLGIPGSVTEYSEPTVHTGAVDDINQTGIPSHDSRDRMLEELKRYPVKETELIDQKAKQSAGMNNIELNQVPD